jgi:tetratricopeptide (TPR) repeat protein
MSGSDLTQQWVALRDTVLNVETPDRLDLEELAAREAASLMADLGRALFQLGKPAEAEVVFSHALLRLTTGRASATQDLLRRLLSNRGRCRYALHRPKEAIHDWAASWTRAAPNDRAVLQTLAHAALDEVLREHFSAKTDAEVLKAVNSDTNLVSLSHSMQRMRLLSGVFQTTNLLDEAVSEVEKRFPKGNRAGSEKLAAKGDKLTLGQQTTDWGNPMSKRECYERALAMDPRNTKAWHSLANFMYFNMVPHEAASVSGEAVSRQHCCIKALELDARISHAWSNLSLTSAPDDDVLVVGSAYNPKRCLEQALELDPKNWHAWYSLAMTPPPHETPAAPNASKVCVNGEMLSWRACCERALDIDSKNAHVWCNLALAMGPSDRACVKGELVSNQQCFINALAQDPKFAKVWLHLGTTLTVPGETVTIDQEKYTAKRCFEQAVFYDRAQSTTWFHLAMSLQAGETASVFGETYSKKRCLELVVEFDPNDPDGWCQLGLVLQGEEVAGLEKLSKVKCFAQALTVDPRCDKAWPLLVSAMGPDDVVTVGTNTLSRLDCQKSALQAAQQMMTRGAA